MIAKLLPALLVLACAVGGCGTDQCQPSEVFVADVSDKLRAAKPFQLAATSPFAWDRVYVFPPYTPIEDAATRAGVKATELSGSEIEESDGIALLVFVEKGRQAKCLDFPRHRADFVSLKDRVPAGNATLLVGRKSGNQVLVEMAKP